MAKKEKVVSYKLTDGCVPKKDGSLLKLGAPYEFRMIAGETVTLKLGISFEYPVILFDHPLMTGIGANLTNGGKVISPNQEVVVVLDSLRSDGSSIPFERGDSVAYAWVFEP